MAEANGTGAPQFGHSWEKAYIPVLGFLSASNCLAGYGRSQPRPTGISGQQFLGLPEERVPRVRPGEQSLLTSSPTRHQRKQAHLWNGWERGWAKVRPHGVRVSPQPVGDDVRRLTSIGHETRAGRRTSEWKSESPDVHAHHCGSSSGNRLSRASKSARAVPSQPSRPASIASNLQKFRTWVSNRARA